MKSNIGIALGLFGIIFSIYLYSLSIADRTPVLTFSESPILIAGMGDKQQSEIMIVNKKGKKINGNVWLTEFIFYNLGKKPLKKSEIIEKIYIKNENNNVQILNAKITLQSRPNVVKGLLMNGKKRVNLTYSMLEKDDYIKGQIIYIGEESSSFFVSGVLEGVRFIPKEEPLQLNKFLELLVKNGGVLILLSIFFYYFFFYFSTVIIPIIIKFFLKILPNGMVSDFRKKSLLKLVDKDVNYMRSEKISFEDVLIIFILFGFVIGFSYFQSKKHDYVEGVKIVQTRDSR